MIKKIFVPILKICKSKFIKIEDPRFANREAKQIGTTLTSSWDRMTDYNKHQAKIIQERLKTDQELAQERHGQIMVGRDKKYVSERTVPTEGEILGPSETEPKEEK